MPRQLTTAITITTICQTPPSTPNRRQPNLNSQQSTSSSRAPSTHSPVLIIRRGIALATSVRHTDAAMDITSFVVDGRDKALLYGDYSTYHASLAKRLLNSRKKIGIATRNRGKYSKKEQVTAENVAENHEYVAPRTVGHAPQTSRSSIQCSTNLPSCTAGTFTCYFSPASAPGLRQ